MDLRWSDFLTLSRVEREQIACRLTPVYRRKNDKSLNHC